MRRTAILLLAAPAALALAACGKGTADGRIKAAGTIEATEIHVAARVPGILVAVPPREGDRVDSGAVLAVTDHAELDWQLRQAQAALAAARAQLELAVNGPQPEDLEQAEAGVAQARAQLQAADTDLGRIQQLAATGTATAKQLDDAGTRQAMAAAALRLAEAQRAKLRAGTRAELLAAARAQVAQAEAHVGGLERRIAECTIRAPRAGVITERLMEPGEMASPGSAVHTLTDLEAPWLQVYLTEVEVGRIRMGEAVQVYLDAEPERPRSGRVSHIAQRAEFTPKNVQTKQERVKLVFGVKVALDNADGACHPGLPADAVFSAAQPATDVSGD